MDSGDIERAWSWLYLMICVSYWPGVHRWLTVMQELLVDMFSLSDENESEKIQMKTSYKNLLTMIIIFVKWLIFIQLNATRTHVEGNKQKSVSKEAA